MGIQCDLVPRVPRLSNRLAAKELPSMKHESDPRLVKRLGTFAGTSSLFSMATNRGRLAGWAFHFEIPKSWSADTDE